MPHRLFFAGRFSVKIDNDCIRVAAELGAADCAFDRGERVIARMHFDLALRMKDHHGPTVFRLVKPSAAAGICGREIQWPQQALFDPKYVNLISLIESMIASCDNVGARFKDILNDAGGDAKSRGRVLRIDNDEIQREAALQARQLFDKRTPAGAADNISEYGNLHGRPPCSRRTSMASRSVTIQSSL